MLGTDALNSLHSDLTAQFSCGILQVSKLSVMALIILGIIVLLISLALRSTPSVSHYSRLGTFVGLGFIILGIIVSSFIQIDAGQIGVQKLFGNVQNNVLYSGLHMINPLMEVDRMDVKTQNYTMSGIHDEGQKNGDDAIRYRRRWS